jgi:hypothetical protein
MMSRPTGLLSPERTRAAALAGRASGAKGAATPMPLQGTLRLMLYLTTMWPRAVRGLKSPKNS